MTSKIKFLSHDPQVGNTYYVDKYEQVLDYKPRSYEYSIEVDDREFMRSISFFAGEEPLRGPRQVVYTIHKVSSVPGIGPLRDFIRITLQDPIVI